MRNILRIGLVFAFRDGDIVPCARDDEGSKRKVVLILIAFQTQRLRMLARTIAKLDELLDLLRDTKRTLSPLESMQLMQELAEIRARLLRDNSLKRPNR